MNDKKLLKVSAAVSLFSGLVILFSTIYPIASYESSSKERYPRLISPVVSEDKEKVTLSSLDYTKASNWFVDDVRSIQFDESDVTYYTLSIPKLEIRNALVEVGAEDLSDSLIQYPGTPVPGKTGNSVIFGHSILPQFYDPEDYLAIFSTLPTLEEGDEVRVSYDGVTYIYRVETMFEVLPTELEVLDQTTSNSYLTLITCVPPGHPLKPKRLVVRTKIIPPEAKNEQANAVVGN
jgi:sortase A